MTATSSPAEDTPVFPSLRLGIAGLGTVGCGVIRQLQQQAPLLSSRAGRTLTVTAISARDRRKERGLDLKDFRWHDDPLDLVHDEEVDCILELIGGAEGTARNLVETALRAGKPVITANKALIALHGDHLTRLSQSTQTPLLFEASVAGGIPAIKLMREGLAGDTIKALGGILNGTCNYILSTMEETGRDFDDVLKEAQESGFAEAEPSTDIDGWDTAHKLAILAGIACKPVIFDSLTVEGIRHITAHDLEFARKLGYRVKLLGMVRHHAKGDSVEAWVRPCLIARDTKLAHVNGVFNALTWEGTYSGPMTISGRGAGEGPTATAVIADIIDLARGNHLSLWGRVTKTEPVRTCPVEALHSSFYLRLLVDDTPGVIADISAVLRDQGVSVHLIAQHDATEQRAYLTVITHPVANSAIINAATHLKALSSVHGAPLIITIESLS
ncbi:homoserine dehydrogenase [Acetobacteraceae bacterium ESL0709]|nr:homoserine dehydrogenase [Acetobacteraceae bacterium ESL0697]MDF7678908.1 homoserine dehydrogenase [Acetobacteraceae bacterium ESL0709]